MRELKWSQMTTAQRKAYHAAKHREFKARVKAKRAAARGERNCIDCGGWIDPMRRIGVIRCDDCKAKIHNEKQKRARARAKAAGIVHSPVFAPTVTEPRCRLCKGAWNGSNDAGFYCVACRTDRQKEVVAHILAKVDADAELKCMRNFRYRVGIDGASQSCEYGA